jgi:hypothetical protein
MIPHFIPLSISCSGNPNSTFVFGAEAAYEAQMRTHATTKINILRLMEIMSFSFRVASKKFLNDKTPAGT